jgi:hypothetical protein
MGRSMKPFSQWIDERLNYYKRGILNGDEITGQFVDEASYRGLDIPGTVASLPDEYQSAIVDFFQRFTPEEFLPVSYVGDMTEQEEREYGERLLSATQAIVAYLTSRDS